MTFVYYWALFLSGKKNRLKRRQVWCILLGDSTPYFVLDKQFTEFRLGRPRRRNAERSGRSTEVAPPETIPKNSRYDVCRSEKGHKIVEALGKSNGSVFWILKQNWVWKALRKMGATFDNKRNCMATSKENLALSNRNLDEIWSAFRYRGRNVDSPLYSGDQVVVPSMSF